MNLNIKFVIMGKINSVENVIEILTKINKQTIRSAIEDSGFGPIYMRKGGFGLRRSPSYTHYFGSKKINTKKVNEVISLVEQFPNDFVWLKHSDYISNIDGGKNNIYILMYVNMLIPGITEKPKMLIAFSPAHFNYEPITTEKLEILFNKKENKDRCELFKIKVFDCVHPKPFDVMKSNEVVIELDNSTQDAIFNKLSKHLKK